MSGLSTPSTEFHLYPWDRVVARVMSSNRKLFQANTLLDINIYLVSFEPRSLHLVRFNEQGILLDKVVVSKCQQLLPLLVLDYW